MWRRSSSACLISKFLHVLVDPLESLTPGNYLSLARELGESEGDGQAIDLVLLSSNSFSFLEPYLVVECARRNLSARTKVAPFGQIEQYILSAADTLVSDRPVIVVIALRIEDVYADAYLRPNGEDLDQRARACVDRLEHCVKLVQDAVSATVLVANFAVPDIAGLSDVYDGGRSNGVANIVNSANADLSARLADRPGAYVWDYAGLVKARGASSWTDSRLWHLARQPIAAPNLPHAAAHLARTVAGTIFPRIKCLVLDLDNTLWGGVAGEDGLGGIQISDDYPGNVFKAFQHAVLGLKDRGVLLAISSKNDEDLVRKIFDRHPDLILRWQDFSSTQINWNPKSDGIKSIAADLNIGVDAIAFFDDNPVEREEVRQNASGVSVIDVPKSPLGYVDALFEAGSFDAPQLSQEDSKRAVYYQNESRRQAARQDAGTMEEFLASLDMEVTLGSVGPETLARVVQLIGKTNQFNLTTRRHSQSDVQRMADDGSVDVRWYRLNDKYGDSGIIGVVVIRYDGAEASLDTFLMSCRAMNREVENAMLADAVRCALDRDCTSLVGEYIATDRNAVVRDFYRRSGFSPEVGNGDGKFRLDLAAGGRRPLWPAVVRRASGRLDRAAESP